MTLFSLDPTYTLLLVVCLGLACAFEFVNGFHDTANAVATVIYTNSLKPQQAVLLSAFLNFAGVLSGGIGVAMGIVNLLPVETLVDQNINHSVAMVLAILGTAITWNLSTWYFGLPASSSHTLIGSILGVGLAFSLMPEASGTAVNWSKAGEIGLSLLISPVFGFSLTVFLMFMLRRFVTDDSIFKEPKKDKAPPFWIRAILMLTCSSVSYAHGWNDGQKGVGLIMLILIGIVPAHFALNTSLAPAKLQASIITTRSILSDIPPTNLGAAERASITKTMNLLSDLDNVVGTAAIVPQLPEKQNFRVRKDILLASKEIDKVLASESVALTKAARKQLEASKKGLREYTDYAPRWVIYLISISLGLGTMVGWKRIVLTIGEKIGKQHLTYAQGASAEVVASLTIGLANVFTLPVSTTHVLSSGIAGSMVANKGLKNLQPATIRSILLAWVLTLPVTVIGAGLLYILFRNIL